MRTALPYDGLTERSLERVFDLIVEAADRQRQPALKHAYMPIRTQHP